jgi:uncharacterized membrane protein
MAKKRRKSADAAETEPKAAKAEAKGAKAAAKVRPAHARRKVPNWPVLILALAGMALAGFLAVSAWVEQALPYCSAGSPCDVVQSSRWSRLLGIPIAAWGFGAYAALAWVASQVRAVELHWKLSWTLSLLALAVSVYLTAISLFVLQATCAYCLASAGVALALFAVVAWQSPQGLADFKWPSWLAQTGALAAVLLVALHLYYSGVFTAAMGPEDLYLRALAEHLGQSEAQFYGAAWCERCQRQKDLFGASAGRLPYVECSPARNAPLAPICAVNGVENFPTWIIRNRRYEGMLTPEELARYSVFVPPPGVAAPGEGTR